jgi:hypothetical protein
MSQIPAPLLSRRLGAVVLILSVLAAAALPVTASLGLWPLVAAIVLVAVQQAFLALAILVLGRTGLAGRHALFPVVATLGSAGILLLDAVAEIVGLLLALLGPLPTVAVVTGIGGVFAALTALLLVLFGVALLRARVARPVARALPIVAGVAVAAAAGAAILAPPWGLLVGPVIAVLLSGGIALALFTPRALQ